MITDEVIRIANAKKRIAEMIRQKGVSVDDSALIDSYPDLISQISAGGGWHCDNPLCIYTTSVYERTVTLNKNRLFGCEISYDGINWEEPASTSVVIKAKTVSDPNARDRFYVRAAFVTLGNTTSVIGNNNSDVHVTGDVSSLIEGTKGELYPYCFQQAFYGVKCVIDEDLVLPKSDTIYNYSFQNMFNGCTLMTKAPSMGTYKTVQQYGCDEMFYGCSTMVTGPTDFEPETLTGVYCCYRMFYNCVKMIVAMNSLPVASIGERGLYQMFYGCSVLTKAPDVHGTTTTTTSIYAMYYNCKAITSVRLMGNIPVTTHAGQIFYGCSALSDIYCHNTTSLNISGWVNTSTKQTGTLHKKAGVDLTGLPSGWTVVEDLE